MLPGTAQAWIEALSEGLVWDERRDSDRVRKAFVLLAKNVRRWPAPSEFMDSLPKIDVIALPVARDPNDPYEIAHQRRLAAYHREAEQ